MIIHAGELHVNHLKETSSYNIVYNWILFVSLILINLTYLHMPPYCAERRSILGVTSEYFGSMKPESIEGKKTASDDISVSVSVFTLHFVCQIISSFKTQKRSM